MKNILSCFGGRSFISLLSLTIIVCCSTIVFSEENKIITLENKILLYVGGDTEKILNAIDEIDTLSTEEAVTLCVRLSDYWLGEAPGRLLIEKITKIGDRILPYLVQKRNLPMNCKENYSDLCYKSIEERNVWIGIAIEGIKEGMIFYTKFPEKLNIEAQKYLKTIEIFIQDYKQKKGIYPEHLLSLKEYTWDEYGYKIKILNPWGQPYRYFLSQNNDKYRLEIGDDSPYGWPRQKEGAGYTSPVKKKGR